jgi:nucleotide-binding universal stress UspA family protein
MYKHIMVPLDGSKLAECVLPHVESIAMTCEAGKLSFVRVVTPLRLYEGDESRIPAAERQRLEADSMEVAKKYLDQLMKQTKYDNVTAQSVVLFGNINEQLIDFADKNEVDLIIIATHGRSGPSRWVWGSVADRILRSACVPALMVRAPGCVVGI